MLDRLIFAGLYRLAPKVLGALAIVKPETVNKWHRAGFRRHSASDRGMDRKSDHGSLRLEQAPHYLIRDRDGTYGEVFIRRLLSMGIRDRPTSPHSPWQDGYAERLIARSAGNALTTLLCSVSATSVTYGCRT